MKLEITQYSLGHCFLELNIHVLCSWPNDSYISVNALVHFHYLIDFYSGVHACNKKIEQNMVEKN